MLARYDNCDPTVSVSAGGAAAKVLDERDFVATFSANTPCVHPGSVNDEVAMEYNLAAPPLNPHEVFKYAMNYGWSTCSTANPVTWNLLAQDNRGVKSAEVRLTRPDGAVGSWTTTGVLPVSNESGVSHRVTLTQANAPGIDSLEGLWQMELRVTDLSDRVTTPQTAVKWRNRLLGSPVKVIEVSGVPNGYVSPTAYGPQMNNMSTPFSNPSTKMLVKRIRILNGTPYPTMVSVTPKVTAKIKRTYHRRNVLKADGQFDAKGPSCNPNAFKPATAQGTCIAQPEHDTLPLAEIIWTEVQFIKGVEARQQSGNPSSPIDEGPAKTCQQKVAEQGVASGDACAAHQWEVPAGISGNEASLPGIVEVRLWTNQWTFLWDAAKLGGTPADLTVTKEGSTTSYQVFGTTMAWGSAGIRTQCSGLNCFDVDVIHRNRWVKYLYDVDVVANDAPTSDPPSSRDQLSFGIQARARLLAVCRGSRSSESGKDRRRSPRTSSAQLLLQA